MIAVSVDGRGQMIPTDLETKINEQKENGGEPILVVATLGKFGNKLLFFDLS